MNLDREVATLRLTLSYIEGDVVKPLFTLTKVITEYSPIIVDEMLKQFAREKITYEPQIAERINKYLEEGVK